MSTEGFKVTFHPEAEKSLNSLAEEVLRSLRPMDEQAVRRQGRESSASIMPVVTVDYSEVRDLRLALVREDLFGKTTSFYVDMPTGRVGLSEQDYVKFERLVQTTISRPELRDVMSEKFVASTLTDWLKDRHSGVL